MTDETDIVIVMPITVGEPVVPAGQVACLRCKCTCWLSNTMMGRYEAGDLRPLCLMCMPPYRAQLAEPPTLAVADEQREELKELGLLEDIEQFVEHANRLQKEQP